MRALQISNRARGEPNRERIGLTMSRVLAREMEYSKYSTSPAGVLTHAEDRLSEKLPGGGERSGDGGGQ